ncbi:MAG TPA: hypothetical protein VEV43_05615 [Actinomycetota bacterium]|nr:hypothetical protein [Actinomycetota bacterium]
MALPNVTITRDDLTSLLQPQEGLTVSLYHPTVQAAVEPEESSLHLKNLLARAKNELVERGVGRQEIDDLLAPAYDLLGDRTFWQHQLQGLAVFLSPGGLRHFRLPFEVGEMVSIGDSVHLKPLLPVLNLQGHFFVLALAQDRVQMYRATQHSIEEIDLTRWSIPTSLDEALRYDDLQKPESQHPNVTGPGRGQANDAVVGDAPNQRTHAFHGHGEDGDDPKERIRRFFNVLDDGLSKPLAAETAPLVLAGVEYLRPIFKSATSYDHVLDEGVDGNPEGFRPDEIHAKAWNVVQPYFRERIRDSKDRYGAGVVRGTASDDLPDILAAAYEGRVGVLFALRGVEAWGIFDLAGRRADVHAERGPGDVDLTDLACRQTLATGGEVFVVEEADMPSATPVAAVYRY